jgi:two-component system, LytTR family, sensor kinase
MKSKKQQNKLPFWIFHIIIWAAIFMLPYIFRGESEDRESADDISFRNLDNVTDILWIGLFYLNAIILIPRLFYAKRYTLYAGSLIVSFLIVMLIHGVLFIPLVPERHFNFFKSSQHNIIPFLFTILVSTTYKIVYDKVKKISKRN